MSNIGNCWCYVVLLIVIHESESRHSSIADIGKFNSRYPHPQNYPDDVQNTGANYKAPLEIKANLIKFINEAATSTLIVDKIPLDLLEFFQNIPAEILHPMIHTLANNEHIDPNVHPDIISLISYLKKRQSRIIVPKPHQMMSYMDKLKFVFALILENIQEDLKNYMDDVITKISNFNGTHILWKVFEFFKNDSDFKNILQMIMYDIPKFNSPAFIDMLDGRLNFIKYLVKLKHGTASMSDLTPETLSIIIKLEHPLKYFPPLPARITPKSILETLFCNTRAEFKYLIDNIMNNNRMITMSPQLLRYITSGINIQYSLIDTLTEGNYKNSQINLETLIQLLQLITDTKLGNHIDNIPNSLINIILNLQGTEFLYKTILDVTNRDNPSDLQSVLLHILEMNDNEIPPPVRYWLSTLPNGNEYISFLQRPGKFQCNPDDNKKVKCAKHITQGVSPQHPAASPNILEELDNNKIRLKIIELIKKNRNNDKFEDNTLQALMELIFRMPRSEKLDPKILSGLQDEIKMLCLMITKENGGKEIPQHLRELLLVLPIGKQIIEDLEKCAKIECNKGNVDCNTTTVTELTSKSPETIIDHIPDDLSTELQEFIISVINKNNLPVISSNLFKFISKHPNLKMIINDIFQKNNISTTKVNQQILTQILQLIIQVKSNTPIKDVPVAALKIVLKLTGAQNLSNVMLDWIDANKQKDLMRIILQIIKENKNNEISLNLREWLLSLPKGKKIVEYLQQPGEIECAEYDDQTHCFKTVLGNDNSNVNVNVNINKNKK